MNIEYNVWLGHDSTTLCDSTRLDSRPLWLMTWLDSSTDLSDSWLDSDSTLMTRDSTRDSSEVTRQQLWFTILLYTIYGIIMIYTYVYNFIYSYTNYVIIPIFVCLYICINLQFLACISFHSQKIFVTPLSAQHYIIIMYLSLLHFTFDLQNWVHTLWI